MGGCIACYGRRLLEKLKIDDPTGCVSAHALSGMWGLISIGFFAEVDNIEGFAAMGGLFKSGDGRLLGVQLLAVLAVTSWSILLSLAILFALAKTIGLRVTEEQEHLGADIVEHDITGYDKLESRRMSALNGLNRFVMRLESESKERSQEKRRERNRTLTLSAEQQRDEVVLSVERLSRQDGNPTHFTSSRRNTRNPSVFDRYDSTESQDESSRIRCLTARSSRSARYNRNLNSGGDWPELDPLPPVE